MLLCLSSGTDLKKSRHVLKSLSLCNKVLSYLILSLSLSPLRSRFLCLCLCLPVSVSLSVSACLSVSVSVFFCLCLSLSPSSGLGFSVCLCLVSLLLFPSLSFCPSPALYNPCKIKFSSSNSLFIRRQAATGNSTIPSLCVPKHFLCVPTNLKARPIAHGVFSG